MRLLWVAATVVSGGLAVPIYILAWIILPRDDRVADPWHSAVPREPIPPPPTSAVQPPAATTDEWWRSEHYAHPAAYRNHRHHPRTTGVVLVALGILFLAANAGLFTWVEWRTMWPLIFIGLGFILLARQSGWGR